MRCNESEHDIFSVGRVCLSENDSNACRAFITHTPYADTNFCDEDMPDTVNHLALDKDSLRCQPCAMPFQQFVA